ncbi:hypothetical protein MCOR25_003316 [Pyricularia grisea]|uniref:Uncharacterized protein n=1 Tax=Pyricularia grisea TaxID=148305 RepID=A0A6P8B3N0_PYRGI|nr:hypothetical protein PgNI_06303 [Pyricularia grisea]KAI6373929.1 hypothetical protein MCOR25_003316 [Pyricularia grisea]TLD09912.1 hypothetical protein PgNI_06303 [Pyricularia grisea]
MELNRKYSALPDLDTAPDIYETPELTDGQTNTVKSTSDDEIDDQEPQAGVVKQRLRPGQARARFTPSNVDARDVDFSDRVTSKRKSYKVTNRRHRILEDGTEELGDLSDDDEAETLERKVKRLQREVEEARAEYAKRGAAAGNASATEGTTPEGEIDSLSRILDSIVLPDRSLPTTTVAATGPVDPVSPETVPSGEGATYTVTYAPTYQQSHALAKAADFDKRLLLLESCLGIGSSAAPELDSGGLSRAILPTLETLTKQIGTLSSASTVSLDGLSRRVRTLIQDASELEKSRKLAKAAQDALESTQLSPALKEMVTNGDDDEPRNESEQIAQLNSMYSEQTTKINALYGTLSTIENLAPLLPPLLDRLRSLRAIHADAAAASETLDNLEQNQSDMAAEIRSWRVGLDKVEAAMRDGEASMEKNANVIEGWVKDLEKRVMALP